MIAAGGNVSTVVSHFSSDAAMEQFNGDEKLIGLQNFSAIPTSADRVVIGSSETGDPSLVAAKYSLKDRAAMLLSHVPGFKNTEMVKNYVNNLQSDNKAAIGLFLNALSKSYGVKGASAAADALVGTDKPLNARAIKDLSELAANLHGKGEAKDLDRQVVVRIWPSEGMLDVGHTSVSIKNSADPSSPVNEHVSWLPAWTGDSLFEDLFATTDARDEHSYQTDKAWQMSDRTNNNLKAGEEARAKLDRGENSAESREAAQFVPRATQTKLNDGNWGTSAQKVYLPMVGDSKSRTDPQAGARFVLFGLNEKAIKAEAASVKDAATSKDDSTELPLGFKEASKTQNAAAITARMLASGGAGNYAQFQSAWFVEDTGKLQTYAQTVQARMDDLNGKAQRIETKFADEMKTPAFKEKSDALANDLPSLNRQEKPELATHTEAVRKRLEDAEIPQDDPNHRSLSALRGTLVKNAPTSSDDFNALTLKAQAIVMAMDEFLAGANSLSSDVSRNTFLLGNTLLERTKDFIRLEA